MRILVSAYSCEPNRGSEPGIGWEWCYQFASLGNETWAITRGASRAPIEAALKDSMTDSNLRFVYYDFPLLARWLKDGERGQYLYYFIWQCGVYWVARKLHRKINFDAVQHITFGSIRLPSFLGALGVPFIFGPAGGGEYAPMALRKMFGLRGQIIDLLRDISNFWIRIDPLMRYVFASARLIYVTTAQSYALIPHRYKFKAKIRLKIGSEEAKIVSEGRKLKGGSIRLLYIGRFLYWKGMGLGILAFARAREKNPKLQLTICGSGSAERSWRRLTESLGISQHVQWVGWMPQTELDAVYESHDIFLFPSLHDSGGVVVHEALSRAMPVICLDLGGPGLVVDDSCGFAIGTAGVRFDDVVRDLAHAIQKAVSTPEVYEKLSRGARLRALALTSRKLIQAVILESCADIHSDGTLNISHER
jgi:glycosyltransferase involved in cell wall biosynthesis